MYYHSFRSADLDEKVSCFRTQFFSPTAQEILYPPITQNKFRQWTKFKIHTSQLKFFQIKKQIEISTVDEEERTTSSFDLSRWEGIPFSFSNSFHQLHKKKKRNHISKS